MDSETLRKYRDPLFQRQANRWWRSLSINQMKSFEKKYNTILGMALPNEISRIYDSEVLLKERVADRYAHEFPTQRSLDSYLRAHPEAKKTDHTVKPEKPKPLKKEPREKPNKKYEKYERDKKKKEIREMKHNEQMGRP